MILIPGSPAIPPPPSNQEIEEVEASLFIRIDGEKVGAEQLEALLPLLRSASARKEAYRQRYYKVFAEATPTKVDTYKESVPAAFSASTEGEHYMTSVRGGRVTTTRIAPGANPELDQYVRVMRNDLADLYDVLREIEGITFPGRNDIVYQH